MIDDRLSEALVLMGMRVNMLYLSAILEDYIEERNRNGGAVDRNWCRAVTCSERAGKG